MPSLHCLLRGNIFGWLAEHIDVMKVLPVDITASTTVKSIRGFILKDAETYSITDNGAVNLIEGHEYRLELRSEIALSGFAFSASTFYIESIIY